MRTLLLISDVLARLTSGIGRIVAWLLVPLMLVIVSDVVLRRFYAVGSIRLQEMEWHLHATLFLLTIGYAYVANAHVRIELLRESFSSRTKAAVEIVCLCILVLPLTWILIDYSYDLVVRSYNAGERSPHAGGLQHRWLIKAAMPVGFLLLAAGVLSVLLRAVVILFGQESLRAAASTPMLPATDPDRLPSQPDRG